MAESKQVPEEIKVKFEKLPPVEKKIEPQKPEPVADKEPEKVSNVKKVIKKKSKRK